jgi:hypothetical protein
VTVSLARTAGSGAGGFYSASDCTGSVITSTTLATGDSTTTVYYYDESEETLTLQATVAGNAGTAFSQALLGPVVTSIATATTSHSTSCAPISVYFANASNSTMVESKTLVATVTLTQTGGPVTGIFYSDVGCSTSISSGAVSTVPIAANSTNKTVYFNSSGNLGSFTFSASWATSTTNGTGYTNGFTL